MKRSSPISAKEIYDNPLVNKVQDAASDVISRYTVGNKRKNSIAGFIAQALQILNMAAAMFGPIHPGLAIGFGVVILLVEVAFQAFTKGPLTESAVEDIKRSLAEREAEPQVIPIPTETDKPRSSDGFSIF